MGQVAKGKTRSNFLSKITRAPKEAVERFLRKASQTRPRTIPDLLLLVGSGLVILYFVGVLQNGNPLGDDALFRIATIRSLAKNFPNFQWDPHAFNGYSPDVGFPWTAYAPPALLMLLGGDPIAVFRFTFFAYFFLTGFSVYYFARSIRAHRIVSVALPLLLWSTNTFWNYSIWGGAYARIFSLPFTFTALALTYKYVALLNRGEGSPRKYLLLLFFWVLTFLGDVYVAIIGVGVALWLVLLSPGGRDPRLSVVRLSQIFLPVLALTSWYLIPLFSHALAVSPLRNDVTPNPFSQLLLAAPEFNSSLNPVYLPSIAALGIFLTVVTRRKRISQKQVSFALGAMIVSLSIVSGYFFIMGWVPALWPYLPRLMAAYDSNNALSFMFVMLLPALFVALYRTSYSKLATPLAVLFLLFVIVNASIILPGIQPADWTPLTDSVRISLGANVAFANDYRVSLDGRLLTRSFPFYYPNVQQTGGRSFVQDQSPLYQSWYQTEVYYKEDLSTLGQLYFEDQPGRNVSQYIGGPSNFAETRYWLDWYGSNSIVLLPGFYPVTNTAKGYANRSAVFSTTTVLSNYEPLVFIRYNEPEPILTATNTTAVGFYSEQQNSFEEYNYLLAVFSHLGLSSKYVVTIALSSIDNIPSGLVDLVITDGNTYARRVNTFNSLSNRGIHILVTSSRQTATSTIPATSGKGSLTQLPDSLSQLSQQGLAGAYHLFQQIPSLFQIENISSRLSSSYSQQNVVASPSGWSLGYSKNAVGSLQRGIDNFTVTVNIPDPGSSAQVNIDYALPNPAPLFAGLEPQLSVQPDTNITLGLVFTSGNFSSNYLADNVMIPGGAWSKVAAPFSSFTDWKDPSSKFAFADKFGLAVNIPPGHSRVNIQFRNVSIAVPGLTIYDFPLPLLMSRDGLVTNLPTMIPPSSAILSDSNGDLLGSYDFQDGPSPVVPLADFTSNGNRSFSRVLLVGGNPTQPLSISILSRPPWVLDPNDWTTNQNLNIPLVPNGFRGLIWKETYTGNWKVLATDRNGSQSSVGYYSAGPGLIYIPLNDPSLVSLSITYIGYSLAEMTFFLGAALTLVPVILLRKRISRMGGNRSFRSENETTPNRVRLIASKRSGGSLSG